MSTLFQVRVAASTDDGWISGSSIGLTTSSLYMGDQTAHYGSAMRFLNVTVPPGKVIDSAFIYFRCRNTYSATVARARIRAQAADNPVTFSDITDFRARLWTAAFSRWDPIPAMTAGVYYTAPEMKDCIQEVINRPGWASGQAMVIYFDDDENLSSGASVREVYSWNGSASTCPQLNITYSDPPPASGGGPANLVAAGII